MYLSTFIGELSILSKMRTVHDGPNRRTQEMTLRWFQAGIRKTPSSQKAQTFFSDVTGVYSPRDAIIVSSGRMSCDGTSRSSELFGLNCAFEPIAPEPVSTEEIGYQKAERPKKHTKTP